MDHKLHRFWPSTIAASLVILACPEDAAAQQVIMVNNKITSPFLLALIREFSGGPSLRPKKQSDANLQDILCRSMKSKENLSLLRTCEEVLKI